MTNTGPVAELDKLRPLKEGAKLSGLKYHHLQRATKRGLVGTYDVDFEANVIRVRRAQMRYGALSQFTKTESGRRDIPMSPILREMLLAWRVRCPRREGQLERVFPAPGSRRAWPLPREGGGGPLVYGSFRKRYWAPMLSARPPAGHAAQRPS